MGKQIIVSTTGSDNAAGTINAPVLTLARALAMAQAGDTISLRGGEYAGGLTVKVPGVTIQSIPGEHAVISAPNNDDNIPFTLRFGVNSDGSTLRDIEVKGGGFYAVKLESEGAAGDAATNITIENCTLHDSGRDVIKITPGCDNVKILYNEIYNSGMRDDSNAEGIDAVNVDNIVIRGNHIHDIATTGLYVKGGSKSPLIEDNLIEDTGISQASPPNSGAGIGLGYETDSEWFDADNPTYIQTFNGIVRNNTIIDTADAGIMILGSSDAQVYGNTLYNVAKDPWDLEAGIYIGGQNTYVGNSTVFTKSHNLSVTDNTIVLAADPDVRPDYYGNHAVTVTRSGGSLNVTGSLVMDDNTYYQLGNATGAGLFGGAWPALTLAQWQAQLGLDQNSQYTMPAFDPDDVTVPGGPSGGNPGPVDPGPVDPGPVDPGPVDPGPVDPGPVDPSPVDPASFPTGIVSTYPAPGSSVASDGELVIEFAAPILFDYTRGKLRIVHEPDGAVVAELDFKSGEPGDRTKSLKIDIDQFDLKVGETYSVVADHEFVSINMKPWDVGKIDRGAWSFTVSESSSGAASVQGADSDALEGALTDNGADDLDAFDASTISLAERAVLDLAGAMKTEASGLGGDPLPSSERICADAVSDGHRWNETLGLARTLGPSLQESLSETARDTFSSHSHQASSEPSPDAGALEKDVAALIRNYVGRSAESDSGFFVL